MVEVKNWDCLFVETYYFLSTKFLVDKKIRIISYLQQHAMLTLIEIFSINTFDSHLKSLLYESVLRLGPQKDKFKVSK